MLSMRDKKFWRNLNAVEKAELMYLQMSPAYTTRGGYLPEDSSECGVCGTPILGTGWCSYDYERYDRLMKKGKGVLND